MPNAQMTGSRLQTWPLSRMVSGFLLVCILMLLSLSVTGNLVLASFPHLDETRLRGIIRLLDVDKEVNIPTWFSSSILLISGLLSAVTGILCLRTKRARGYTWITIGVIFFLLSMEEVIRLHERSAAPTREFLGVSGVLYFAWVIPAMVIVLFLWFAFRRFVGELPRHVGKLVRLSAAVYLGGAIGMEMIGGLYFDGDVARRDLIYTTIVTLEEGMEMTGVMIFIHALLSNLETSFSLTVNTRRAQPAPLSSEPS